MRDAELTVSAPGRICLFGEHQDYLGLDVIAAAVDVRIRLSGRRRVDSRVVFDCPDVGERDDFDPAGDVPYLKRRDYLRSVVNVLKRSGVSLPTGWDIQVRGTIPINAGTSSSSALVIAWIRFIVEAADRGGTVSPEQVAEWGFLSEVAEFGEPGGKMDHYASARGGVLWIRFEDPLVLSELPVPPGAFVLADSLEKKDTTGTLGSVKSRVLAGVAEIKKSLPAFSLKGEANAAAAAAIARLPAEPRRLVEAALRNRDLTRRGVDLFRSRPFDGRLFGELLLAQQRLLRDDLGISTPKIDRILDAALAAGGRGGKINGSGGGGCAFVYAPERAEAVAEACARAGGRPVIIRIDAGARVEPGRPADRSQEVL
jgi:galactokinase